MSDKQDSENDLYVGYLRGYVFGAMGNHEGICDVMKNKGVHLSAATACGVLDARDMARIDFEGQRALRSKDRVIKDVRSALGEEEVGASK